MGVLALCACVMCITVSIIIGLQPGNRERLLCAPDGESHGEGIRERGERQRFYFLSNVNCHSVGSTQVTSGNHNMLCYFVGLRMPKLTTTMNVAGL